MNVLSAIKRVAFSTMGLAIVIVMVACGGAGAPGAPGEPGEPGKPGEPGQPAGVPPAAVGAILPHEVAVGDTGTLDVSAYFNEPEGQDLTYTATSSAPEVASATIDGSMLTIAGLADGLATITVTATDTTGLSARQTISVTVGAGADGEDGEDGEDDTETSDIVIDGKGKTAETTIGEGQTLESGNTDIVTVALNAGSTTVWTLTGSKKGSTSVNVLDAGAVVNTLSVMVKNTAPGRTAKQPDTTYVMQPGTAAVPHNPKKYKTADDYTRRFHEANIEPRLFFEDADGAADIKSYVARSSSSDVLVVKTTGDDVILDVLKAGIGGSITLTLHAVDKDGAESGTLAFDVELNTPLSDVYDVTQYRNGQFKSIDVWDREDVKHLLTFKDTLVQETDGTTATYSGYEFARQHHAVYRGFTELDWVPTISNRTGSVDVPAAQSRIDNPAARFPKLGFVNTATALTFSANPLLAETAVIRGVHHPRLYFGETNPDDVPPVAADDGSDTTLEDVEIRHYYEVSTSGNVAIANPKGGDFHGGIGGDGEPGILLKVTGAGPSTGTVTITYYLLIDEDGNEYYPKGSQAAATEAIDADAGDAIENEEDWALGTTCDAADPAVNDNLDRVQIDPDDSTALSIDGVPKYDAATCAPFRDSTAENSDNKWVKRSETLTVNILASRERDDS